jgi:hypothetical protein
MKSTTYLDDIQIRSSSSTDIDKDRTDERLLSEILDCLGHGGGEEKGLTLSLGEEGDGERWEADADERRGEANKISFAVRWAR